MHSITKVSTLTAALGFCLTTAVIPVFAKAQTNVHTMTTQELEANFGSALHLPRAKALTYFQGVSPQKPATVSTLELATARYYGITNFAWEPGHTVWSWSHAIGLLKGVPGTKDISVSSTYAIRRNLRRMNQGYYWANGRYHLQYRPFDVATAWAKDPDVNSKMISSLMPVAIHEIDSITFTRNNDTRVTTFVSPALSSHNRNFITIGSAFNNPTTDGGHSSYTMFSFNGVAWKTTTSDNPKSTVVDPFGYNSGDPDNGGMTSPPKIVYVRCYGNAQVSTGYYIPKQMILNPVTVDLKVRGKSFSLDYFSN